MSETGATAEQIEAAVQRRMERWRATYGDDGVGDDETAMDGVRKAAADLVPPGMVIVPAAAVAPPAVLAALKFMLECTPPEIERVEWVWGHQMAFRQAEGTLWDWLDAQGGE